MLVDTEVFARRLRAARELSGLSQQALGRLSQESHRLGLHDVARIERGGRAPAITLKHVQAYALHTGLPENWFTENDLKRLFATEPEDADSRLDRLEDAIRWVAEMALDQDEANQFEQMLSTDQRSSGREPGGGS